MSQLGTKAFLQHQKEVYLQHSRIVDRAQTSLNHQHRLQSHDTIPKKYKPKPPVVIDPSLNKTHMESFQIEYSKLFRQALKEAIIKNTTTLELEKARCQDVLRHTEKVLCLSPDPPSLVLKWYKAFLRDIKATEHVICPELKIKLGDTSTVGTTMPSRRATCRQPKRKRPSKRKTTSTTPPATKQKKIDHFLVKGHQITQNQT